MRWQVILLGLLVLVPGCLNQTACNRPYILVGDDCCLDVDDNSICDRDDAPSTTSPSTAAPTTTTPSTVITIPTTTPIVASTSAPTTSVMIQSSTILPTTTTQAAVAPPVTLAPTTDPNEFSIVYRYRHGAGYFWVYRVPAISKPDEYTRVNLQVKNSKNITFHLHLLDASSTEKCWESPRFTDCLGGIADYNSVRHINGTFNITANYSISIDNKLEGSEYTVNWTFISPTAEMAQVWDHWKNEGRGCLYYGNNGTICESWNFRDCWRSDLEVCNKTCCKITRTDKNITWYQKCTTAEEFHETYKQWPYGYEILGIPDHFWYSNKFRDNNCQDPTSTFND